MMKHYKRRRKDLLEKGISRFGGTGKKKFALSPRCQESTYHPRKGKVPPRNIDKNLHTKKPPN